jgi:hypothetical protein
MAKKPAPKAKTPTRIRIRAQAIQALEKAGQLTADALVQAARDPRHPMHRDFPWDDAKAGHQYRLNLARSYIAEVRIVITTSTRQVIAPAYLRDRNVAPLQGYIATQALQSDHDAAQETLLYELARAQALFERVREIAAALELERELDTLLTMTKDFTSRIRKGAEPVEQVSAA